MVVCRFKTHLEREKELEEKKNNFTNVFIKNIDNDVEEDELIEMFSKFGKITSCKVAKEESDDELGDDEVLNIETVADKNKGFAFVNFEDSAAAKKAVEELNGIDMSGKKLFVGRAQKKLERKKELEQQFQELKKEKMKRFVGLNLYVKNIDDSIDDDKLRRAFSPYGTITSAKVMEKEGKSKGFGFVCFTTPEEATKAVTEMNGRIIVAKPLYVALAQRKEDRRVDLAKQHIQKGTKVSYTNGFQQQMGIGGYSMNQAGTGGHSSSMQQHMGMNGHMMQLPPMYRQPNQMPAQPRWPQQGVGPRHGYVHGMNSGMQRNYRMPVRFRQPLQPRYGGGHPQLWGVRQLGPQNVNQWESQQFSGQYGTQSMGGQPGPSIFGQPAPQFMGRTGPYSQVQPRSQFIGQPTPQHMSHQISHTMGGQPRSSPMSMLGGPAMSEDHTDINGALVQLQQGHVYTNTARNHPTQVTVSWNKIFDIVILAIFFNIIFLRL